MPKSKILSLSGRHALAQEITTAVLRRRGHLVDSRRLDQEEEIWNRLREYDLVVLEVDGSDPEALAVCSRLREFSQVPLLLLVPPAVRLQAIRGLELGADGYLVLPFDRRVLAARAEALMRRYVKSIHSQGIA